MLPSLRIGRVLTARAFTRSARACNGNHTPWFIDADATAVEPPRTTPTVALQLPPDDAPSVVRAVYSELRQSPHLDHSHLAVGPAVPPPPGPALPLSIPRGRRRR